MATKMTDQEMTIGELADRFGLATHVLRHWESVGLLTPAARVNGRRRYHQGHIARVAMIVRGKEAGFELKQLRELFDAPDPLTRRALVERHHAALERRIAQTQAAKEMVEHALECTAKDFTQCLDFQEMVERIAARLPLHADGDDLAQASGGQIDHLARAANAHGTHFTDASPRHP
ncbi:MAG: MerR family transcriptional regulator [Thermomicrobiales bacterium]